MGGIIHESGLNHTAERLSVVIITLNEEVNLKRLLPGIPKGAEIIVVDSHSTDATRAVAQSFGAKVEARHFDNYSAQKNFALGLAARPWTLTIDADEAPDEQLWQEIIQATKTDHSVFYCFSRRLVFLGQAMRFGRTKDTVIRLFPSQKANYQNDIHESLVFPDNSGVVTLKGILWHFSYRDLDDYFSKFNRYTTMMAKSRQQKAVSAPNGLLLATRLPADFLVRYIVKFGFMDGWRGFLWALFGSFYGFVKYAKLKELQARKPTP